MSEIVKYYKLSLISEVHIEETRELLMLAEETRVSLEILNFAVNILPYKEILLDILTLQEAKINSSVGNIAIKNDELYKGIIFSNFTSEARIAVNYKEALFEGFERLNKNGILSIGDIEEINNLVNGKYHGSREDKKEMNRSFTLDLLEYVYNDDIYTIHPLIKIALAYYQIQNIHSFGESSGRIGRILNILFLCQKRYLNHPVLYSGSSIIRNKDEYNTILNLNTELGDYENIIKYILNTFLEDARNTLNIIMEIEKMIKKYTNDDFYKDFKGQKSALKVAVNEVFKKVYIRIDDLVNVGIHRQTASAYLKQFVDAGLLVEQRMGKEKVFRNIELLNLFEGE